MYLWVAQEEQRAGHVETAIVAYRAALEHNPSDTNALRGWTELCQARRSAAAYRLAAERVEHEDWQGALDALADVQALQLTRSATLLAGICHYHLRQDAAARAELELAMEDRELADVAQLFLALLARRDGDAAQARQWLSQVAHSADRGLRQSAELLQRTAHKESRLSLNTSAGLGYDSNVNLAPLGASAGNGQDGMALAQATVVGRPLGASGPFVQAAGQVRQQFTLHDFSLYGIQGAAGWEWVSHGKQVGAQYSYDYLWLGGEGYLSAHRLSGWALWPLGRFTLSGGYDVRFEHFLPTLYADFSGVRHTWTAGLSWSSGIWWAGVSYHLAWNPTRDPALTYFEHGPAVDFQVQLHPIVRAFAMALVVSRPYVGVDPDLGVERRDLGLLAQAGASVALGDSLALVGTFIARGNSSNVAGLSYVELVTSVSLVANLGFF
jgi:tetratricopeptide (TPR) repeat protein